MKNIYEKLLKKVEVFNPIKYSYSRNYIDGDVSRLSPYISRGLISTKTIFEKILDNTNEIPKVQKFLQELTWRDYWQKKWQSVGNIDIDLKNNQSPTRSFKIPLSILTHSTSISAIDQSIKQLYETGYMHNHLRMYTAGIICNIGQYHWLKPAKWMYYHLFDGDWGSNALSWQWVAGTNSQKKYIANQENINKYCKSNDKNTFLDKSYGDLSTYKNVPNELLEESELKKQTKLPKNQLLKIDNNLPIYIYNGYNIDPNWKKDKKANRIFLLEPSHYNKYPVSEKVINFFIELIKEIPDIVVAVMEFKSLYSLINNESQIFFKEHPFNQHYLGNKESRDWIFPEIEASGSFFNYWKKGIKNYL